MDDFYPVVLNNEISPNSTLNKVKNDINVSKKDIIIKIRDHEMSNNTFVRYCIEIYIKNEEHFWFEKVGEKSWNVLRRYSDFESLRTTLIKRYPASLIAPLPGKVNSMIPWRLANQINDMDFIDSRRQRLEWFLTRLISHPKLGCEMILLEFLKNGDNWNEIPTNIEQKLGNLINWRWINVQSRLIQIFDNTNSIQINELLKTKSLSSESLQLVERGRHLQEQVQTLLNCLSKIEEQTSTMHKLYKNYGEAFHDWCANEKEVGDSLQTFSHLCDNFSNVLETPSTGNGVIVLSEKGSKNENICSGLSWYEISLLLQELFDYGESWIDLGGRMALLHRQINRQVELIEDLNNQLERLNKGQSPKGGPLANLKNKFTKSLTSSEISVLTADTEKVLFEQNKSLISLKADKELFDKCLEEEIQYFEEVRAKDLRLVMHSYACNQLSYSQQCLRLWKRARQTVE